MSAGAALEGAVELRLQGKEKMLQDMKELKDASVSTSKQIEEILNKAGINYKKKLAEREKLSARMQLMAEHRLVAEERRRSNPWRTVSYDSPNIAGGLGKFAAGVGAVGAGAAAMAFSGAAAAGSTTLDTLTGSLKMLSLAAGTKTQAPVLKLSALIQSLARATDKAPNGLIGGLGGAATGAAIGARFGGPLGSLIGGLGGGLAGGIGEKAVNDFADKRRMVEKLKGDPKYIETLLKEVNDLEKDWWSNIPFVGNNVEIAKRRGAIRAFESKQKLQGDELKTAGIGMPGSYSGLADLRQQAQLGVFGAGGDLGAENTVRELKLNTEAVNKNTGAIEGGKGAVNSKNVTPPT